MRSSVVLARTLLSIPNRHSESCGQPPVIDTSKPDLSVGYFQDQPGEQLVLTYDRRSGVETLQGCDWDGKPRSRWSMPGPMTSCSVKMSERGRWPAGLRRRRWNSPALFLADATSGPPLPRCALPPQTLAFPELAIPGEKTSGNRGCFRAFYPRWCDWTCSIEMGSDRVRTGF